MPTRRNFTASLSTAALVAAAGSAPFALIQRAAAQEVNLFDLAQPVPLGDIVLGSAIAPVTMIEYASMSCGHCAQFHEVTFPKIKAEYIDTSKLRFIFREFPLNIQAAAASMLVRCYARDDATKYHEAAGRLFATQDEWATRETQEQLRRAATQFGMDEAAYHACIGSQEMVDALQLGVDHASIRLKVDSTPTFFINGTRVKGAYPIDEFRKVIDAKLKS